MDYEQLLAAIRTIVQEELKPIKEDVAVLKEDVAVLKEDVAVLKEDVAVLKEDVSVLKQDVKDLKATDLTIDDKLIEMSENLQKQILDTKAVLLYEINEVKHVAATNSYDIAMLKQRLA
jgi:chromosome segregation ATPase